MATFSVNTTNDAGAGSLRDAIEAANLNPGADVIEFVGPVFADVDVDVINITGEALVFTEGETTIIGPGSEGLTLLGDRPIFRIEPGITVAIAGLTLESEDAIEGEATLTDVAFLPPPAPLVIPTINDQPATIYVDENNILVGNAYGAGQLYTGQLFSNTDGSANPTDVIVGTSGRDNVWPGLEGDDLIATGDGNDSIGMGLGNVYVEAGAGDDFVYTLNGGTGNNTIYLGEGTDEVWLDRGNNTVIDTSGNTSLGLGLGNDTVTLGSGDDFIYSLNGGGGNDQYNLGGGTNNVWVEGGNVTITAEGTNVIGLGQGNDTLTLGDGNDVIYSVNGGGGTDRYNLGEGDNVVWVEGGDIQVEGGDGVNSIGLGQGNDTVLLGNGNNAIYNVNNSGGSDTVTVGDGDNLIWLTTGTNTITTGNGNNTIALGNGRNSVRTGNGNNVIYSIAATQNDTSEITTGSGDDQMYLADGNDVINAGSGNNLVFGGDGADVFGRSDGTGVTTILDFNISSDKVSNFNLSEVRIEQGTGADANHTFVFNRATNDLMAILQNVQASTINSRNFVLQDPPSPIRPPEGFGALGVSNGQTYYVSLLGSDTNNGSASSPFRTLGYALTVVQPGETIFLEGGNYGSIAINNIHGTPDAPITIRSNGDAVFSTGSYSSGIAAIALNDSSHIILDGLVATQSLWGIYTRRTEYVTIQNSEVYDIGQEAVRIADRSSYMLILGNRIYDTGRRGGSFSRFGEGVYIGTGNAGGELDGTHHVVIHGNEIFRTSSEAIDLKRGLHTLIAEYNLIYDINTQVRAAVNVMDGPTGAEYDYIIRGNVIRNISGELFNSDGTGIRIFGGGVQVYNNVIYNNEAFGIRSEGTVGGPRLIYNNTVFNGGFGGNIVDNGGVAVIVNNIGSSLPGNISSTAALFVDANTGDFRLAPTALAAIDQGVTLGAVEIDIAGMIRPLGNGYDLGAYESF